MAVAVRQDEQVPTIGISEPRLEILLGPPASILMCVAGRGQTIQELNEFLPGMT